MLAPDKKKHIQAGLAISFVAGLLFTPMWGLIIASTVGALKEVVWDWLLKRGTPEFLDFVATVIGGLGSYLILSLIS